MPHFADRLIAAMKQKKSCVVVGLDPRLERLPPELKEMAGNSREDAAHAIVEFNRGILEAVAPSAVAVKPQAAFYEALGWQGFRALEQTIRMAQEMGLLVIADVKRGDIGSTVEAYARACFEALGADAITVNAYLGSDGVAPFLKAIPDGKGIFVLVKTSNPSSVELQDLDTDGTKVYERMASLVTQWGVPHLGEAPRAPAQRTVALPSTPPVSARWSTHRAASSLPMSGSIPPPGPMPCARQPRACATTSNRSAPPPADLSPCFS